MLIEFLGVRGIRSPDEEDLGGGGVVRARNRPGNDSGSKSSEGGVDSELHFGCCLLEVSCLVGSVAWLEVLLDC